MLFKGIRKFITDGNADSNGKLNKSWRGASIVVTTNVMTNYNISSYQCNVIKGPVLFRKITVLFVDLFTSSTVLLE